MIEIIIAVVGVIIGGGISFFLLNSKNSGKAKLIIEDANKQAEQIKKEKLLQAKEKFIELKSEHDKVINKKNNVNLSLPKISSLVFKKKIKSEVIELHLEPIPEEWLSYSL